MKSSVFVPSHITGFFEILDHRDPLKKGSKGAGVVLDNGIITNIEITEGSGNVDIKINGDSRSKLASISNKTVELIKNRFELSDKKISIKHQFKIPIGTGFGVSAACALGTSMGLVKALDLPLTYYGAGAIAHLAEIEMKSGLGDVIAEMTGGVVIRTQEGSPGWGRTDKIILNDLHLNNHELFVISKTLGEIETSHIIEDPMWKNKINHTGKSLLIKLLETPNIKTFIELSRKFAEETSLMNSELREIVDVLEGETLGASMAMLGNTAFALSKTPDSSVEGVIVSKIDYGGCRLVDVDGL
ncbi:MAG: GHMP kinase [Methanobacterium sp.]|nr:GHMP kinase [Methanobacterium sp.]